MINSTVKLSYHYFTIINMLNISKCFCFLFYRRNGWTDWARIVCLHFYFEIYILKIYLDNSKETLKSYYRAVPKSLVTRSAPKSLVIRSVPETLVTRSAPESLVYSLAPESLVTRSVPKSLVTRSVPESIVTRSAPKSLVTFNLLIITQ